MPRRAFAPALCLGRKWNLRGRGSVRRRCRPSPYRAFLHRLPGQKATSASARPHAHEYLAATFRHELIVLVVGAVMELDDAGPRTRRRFALADDFGGDMHGIDLEKRVRKFHLGHAEIGDGRADSEVVDHDADHQAEGEQRIYQRLTPLRLLLAEMAIDVQRLRV